MRIGILFLFLPWCLELQAQIQQNINKPSGSVSNAIAEIDSIRFNSAGDEMQVVLQNGQVELHQIIEIDSVTFASTPNPLAHSCGADSVHNPALTYGSMTDQEGNVYKTIVIGAQEWMAENLNTSIYRNGEPIPNIVEGTQWIGLDFGAWCYYANNSEYACPFGKLYNWFAVSDIRGICPAGWHVPNDSEWTSLFEFIGIDTPGNKLKSSGLSYWSTTNVDVTNESGFSGIPGGQRFITNGFFSSMTNMGWWWGADAEAIDPNDALSIALVDNSYGVYYGFNNKRAGYSLRCKRD